MSSSARTACSLIEALRGATRGAHARVDALFGSCDFARTADYARFLIAQAAAWETLRPILSDSSRHRADALRDDVRMLGLTMPSPLPVAGDMPAAESLGLRYVLEGSRLGSTVLLRMLDEQAGTQARAASRYLRVSANSEPWKHLSTLLQTHRNGADKFEADIKDALFVFGLFESAWRATDSAQAKAEPVT